MAYTKQNWIDGESPINAERMNHIENGIAGAESMLHKHITDKINPHDVTPAQIGALPATENEIGYWTPVLRGTTTSGEFHYTLQAGKYTKNGNIVTLACDIRIDSVLTQPLGSVAIGGIPFSSGWIDQSFAIGYICGGKSESLRHCTQGSIVYGDIYLRGLLPNLVEGFSGVGLLGIEFKASDTNQVVIETGTNDIQIRFSATYLL